MSVEPLAFGARVATGARKRRVSFRCASRKSHTRLDIERSSTRSRAFQGALAARESGPENSIAIQCQCANDAARFPFAGRNSNAFKKALRIAALT